MYTHIDKTRGSHEKVKTTDLGRYKNEWAFKSTCHSVTILPF